MQRPLSITAAVLAVAFANGISAESPFSIDSLDSVKETASLLSWDAMQYYQGNLTGQVPGILPGPPPAGDYYWWHAATLWASLIDYWHYTGDSTYNQVTMEALLFQVGEAQAYLPINQTASAGSDDQGMWAFAAMLAAERGFPNPPIDQPQWLQLAENVFNSLVNRWQDDETCDGGLRWQISFSNLGYNYMDSISTGVLFGLSSRLARYTGNETYADWADKTWTWLEGINLIDTDVYAIFDGTYADENCTDINKAEFSYANGIYALGCAHMYNLTNGSEKWETRLDKLFEHGLSTFFPEDVATEAICESSDNCSIDMLAMKGVTHQWYTEAIQLAPHAADKVLPVLQNSAKAAVSQCTGGKYSRQCNARWSTGEYDGETGANQELGVLNAVFSFLVDGARPQFTAENGGISKSGGSPKSDDDSVEKGDDSSGNQGEESDEKNDKGDETPDSTGARASISMIVSVFALSSSLFVLGSW